MFDLIPLLGVAAAVFAGVLFFFGRRSQDKEIVATASNGREENFVQRAAATSLDWKRRMEEVQYEHENAMQSMQKRTRHAQELVDNSGVADASCELFMIARRWHRDWLRRERRGSITPERLTLPAEISDLQIDEGGSWISWNCHGARFRLGFDPGLGRFSLAVNSHVALVFDAVGDAKLGNLKASDVVSFRAGNWMSVLNETIGEIRIADLRVLHSEEFDVFGQKMERIDY
jgi:hypothetical protein